MKFAFKSLHETTYPKALEAKGNSGCINACKCVFFFLLFILSQNGRLENY